MKSRAWNRSRRIGLSLACAALAAACVPAPPTAPVVSTKYDDRVWSQVADGAPWGRRAGVETVELDGSIYLVGGRTPNPYVPFPQGPVPGDSTIWGDAWRSDDLGATWTRVHSDAEGGTDAWPARSYHEVVVQGDRMVLLGGQNFLLDGNLLDRIARWMRPLDGWAGIALWLLVGQSECDMPRVYESDSDVRHLARNIGGIK